MSWDLALKSLDRQGATDRMRRLKSQGWSIAEISRMFGIRESEVTQMTQAADGQSVGSQGKSL